MIYAATIIAAFIILLQFIQNLSVQRFGNLLKLTKMKEFEKRALL